MQELVQKSGHGGRAHKINSYQNGTCKVQCTGDASIAGGPLGLGDLRAEHWSVPGWRWLPRACTTREHHGTRGRIRGGNAGPGVRQEGPERTEEGRTNEEERYTRREFTHNAFERSFVLPNTVNGDAIKADYSNGVLRLNVPKKEESKPKKRMISIR